MPTIEAAPLFSCDYATKIQIQHTSYIKHEMPGFGVPVGTTHWP